MTESTAERFRALTPSEFFYRNRELAGFSNPVRALYQAVRELVENALDATDSHMIKPTIKIIMRKEDEEGKIFSVSVEDNGIGIPPKNVPKAFGQLLYSSKYVLRQTRGMFGLGAKMAVLYGQMTTGKPVEVITSTILGKKIYFFQVAIDVKTNTPSIFRVGSYEKRDGWHGTSVKLYLEGDWVRSKSRIYDYLLRTAIIAPYAEIVFENPEGTVIYFERSTNRLPIPPREVKPHPKGVDIEMLKMMLAVTKAKNVKKFLMSEFQNVGSVTADKILARAGISPTKPPSKITAAEVEKLVKAIKEEKILPPRGDHLSFVGAEIIKTGLKAILKPEFTEAVTRKPSVHGGHAFIVEAGIAYGGEISPSDKPVLFRYANKIPLLYDEGSDVSRKVVDRIDWGRYGVVFPAPLVVLVHICSTKIPYKGVGKESVADVPEVEKEVELAVREVARRLKRYLSRKRREREEVEKAIAIAKYIPDVSRGLAKIVGNVNEDMIKKELLKMLNMRLKAFKISSLEDIVLSIE